MCNYLIKSIWTTQYYRFLLLLKAKEWPQPNVIHSYCWNSIWFRQMQPSRKKLMKLDFDAFYIYQVQDHEVHLIYHNFAIYSESIAIFVPLNLIKTIVQLVLWHFRRLHSFLCLYTFLPHFGFFLTKSVKMAISITCLWINYFFIFYFFFQNSNSFNLWNFVVKFLL